VKASELGISQFQLLGIRGRGYVEAPDPMDEGAEGLRRTVSSDFMGSNRTAASVLGGLVETDETLMEVKSVTLGALGQPSRAWNAVDTAVSSPSAMCKL